MGDDRDPIQRASTGDIDLYDIVDWEPRSVIDRVSTRVYRYIKTSLRVTVIVIAFLILATQFLLSGLAAFRSPMLAVYIFASVVPAILLAGYVWKVDVTMREPLELLVGTFILGVLFAGFAAVLNTFFKDFFLLFGGIGLILFFYIIVAPIEETVKWLAIRLFAYRSSQFDAVVDGAVYGAMAGLGFATIENTIYIVEPYMNATGIQAGLDQALQTAAVRTFAGPGHVIYSAFAGYYLGLAKFNPENRGPIVVKGLLIASFIHATYNSIVTNLGAVVSIVPGLDIIPAGIIFIAFIFVYDGFFLLILYRKISAYRDAFVETGAADSYDDETEEELLVTEKSGDDIVMPNTTGDNILDVEESPTANGDSAASSGTDTDSDPGAASDGPVGTDGSESAEDAVDGTAVAEDDAESTNDSSDSAVSDSAALDSAVSDSTVSESSTSDSSIFDAIFVDDSSSDDETDQP